MSSSAQLEREAEQTRSELARTLDELRERMTPGQLVDQAVDYAKDTTGGEFVRNLSRQVAANPLPVMLVGAGVTWLALAKGNGGPRGGRSGARLKGATDDPQAGAGAAARSATDRITDWSAQARAGASDAATQVSEQASSLDAHTKNAAAEAQSKIAESSSALGERAASTYGSVKSGASSAGNAAADAYGRLADTAGQTSATIAQSGSRFGQNVGGWCSDALSFCKTQPLILAGLGMALGAVLGAIMPPTDAEDQLMGETSDRIKDQARGAAGKQIEKVESAVEGGIERARTQAEESLQSAGDATTASLVPQEEDTSAKLPLE